VDNTQQLIFAIIYLKKFVLAVVVALPSHKLKVPNDIIQQQLNQGVIELAPAIKTAKEFYIPHKGIERKQAETTKLRVVYDASTIESGFQPSLKPPSRPPLSRTCCGTSLIDLDFAHSVSRRFETGLAANQNKGRRSRFIAISMERDWERCRTNLLVYSSPVWTDLLPIPSWGSP
jgi:hypothetical protein